MRKAFLTTIGLCATLALGAAAANAETATVSSCLQAQSKVASALATDSSANHDEAVKESHYGRDYCSNSFYAQGMAHYQRAMKLLGIS